MKNTEGKIFRLIIVMVMFTQTYGAIHCIRKGNDLLASLIL